MNFGPEPVFDNRILTRGLSFFLEDDEGNHISVEEPITTEIRNAFGGALTQWMGALQDIGPDLPVSAARAITGMTNTTSGGYVVMTPPQVVAVGCRDSASFVVRYVSRTPALMTVDARVKAARAQIEGRTLWINGVTYPCWRAVLTAELYLPSPNPAERRCMNLTPILVHEIGHALGIAGHQDLAGHPSIMDSVIQPEATRPTREDALMLVQILLRPITGAPPGRLDADARGIEVGAQRRTSLHMCRPSPADWFVRTVSAADLARKSPPSPLSWTLSRSACR